MKSVHIRNYSGPYFPAFGLNTKSYSVSLRIQSQCRKMGTRITQNTVTLYAVLGNLRHVFFEHYNSFVNFIDFRASMIFVKFGSSIQINSRVLMGQLLKWDEVLKCLFALHEKITFCAFLVGSGLNNIFPIHCVKYRNFTKYSGVEIL